MKTMIAMMALSVQIPASADLKCNKGCYEYNYVCVCDIPPNTAESVKPSDEKPPKDKMPSYQRPDVKVLDLPSCMEEDSRQDQIKAKADKEGKLNAGIR